MVEELLLKSRIQETKFSSFLVTAAVTQEEEARRKDKRNRRCRRRRPSSSQSALQPFSSENERTREEKASFISAKAVSYAASFTAFSPLHKLAFLEVSSHTVVVVWQQHDNCCG